MSNTDTFAYSTDGENYTGEYDSREAALDVGREEYPDQMISTGRIVYPERHPDAEALIERIIETTTEESGDWSDGYLESVPRDALDELQAELKSLWDRWEKKHRLEPKFFNVDQVKDHKTDD